MLRDGAKKARPTPAGRQRRVTGHKQLSDMLSHRDVSSCRPLGFIFWVSLHFTQPGLSMPAAAGVVDEKGSEYILAHTGPRELDGHPLGGCGSGFGLVPGYTTLSVRVRANT